MRARMRLWTKQLDEGVHAATSVVSSAIAFRYQKLAIGMEALEEFHKKMPDPVRRTKKLDMSPNKFPLADIGYAPYITRLDHLQLQFLWDKRPHLQIMSLRERRGYIEALEKWFNPKYLLLMKEKGLEVRDRVKAIAG